MKKEQAAVHQLELHARDWFAIEAMKAFLASSWPKNGGFTRNELDAFFLTISEDAYELADEMIAARDRDPADRRSR